MKAWKIKKYWHDKFLDRKYPCEYGDWEHWSECSSKNGPGMKTRKRRKLISFQEESLSIACTPPRNPTNSEEQEELDKIEEHELCMESYRSKQYSSVAFWGLSR